MKLPGGTQVCPSQQPAQLLGMQPTVPAHAPLWHMKPPAVSQAWQKPPFFPHSVVLVPG